MTENPPGRPRLRGLRRLALRGGTVGGMSIPGALALTALALASCNGGSPAGPETAPTEAPSGTAPTAAGTAATVEVRYDQTVVHEELELRLLDVGDSRCPTGVACVWEGEVAVRLEVTRGSEDPVEVQLTLRAGTDSDKAFAHGRLLRLIAVDPYPKYGVTTPREAYVARIEIQTA